MEWTKLILEHLVQIIHYTAWPGAVLIILLIFHKEIKDLMDRLIEFEGRHGIFRFSKTHKLPTSEMAEKAEKTAVPPELSPEAKRILATLWQRQTYHFKDDFSKRWSFRVIPDSDLYGAFMVGFAELLKLGLVGWTRKDGQAILTPKGIEYAKEHGEIRESEDIYRF
jgi:hypothetical protein